MKTLLASNISFSFSLFQLSDNTFKELPQEINVEVYPSLRIVKPLVPSPTSHHKLSHPLHSPIYNYNVKNTVDMQSVTTRSNRTRFNLGMTRNHWLHINNMNQHNYINPYSLIVKNTLFLTFKEKIADNFKFNLAILVDLGTYFNIIKLSIRLGIK